MLHEQLKDFQNTNKISNKLFGIQLSIIFFIIFLVRLYLNFYGFIELVIISLSFFLFFISYFKPSLLSFIQIIFLNLAKFLFKIINPIIMFILYLFIFIPFGLILRIFCYDSLKEKIDKNLKSYWDKSNKNNKKFFRNQF